MNAPDSGSNRSYGRLAEALAEPIKSEVLNCGATSPLDRRFHRLLAELVDDCSDLTPFAADRYARDLAGQFAEWLERQRESDTVRSAELVTQVETLGTALKQAKISDASFFGGLENDLDQLELATSRTAARPSSRAPTLVARVKNRVLKQQASADLRIEHLSALVQSLNDELCRVRLHTSEDPLTGLASRGTFDVMLSDFLRRARLAPFRFCLVLFDLDRFKAVNDTHGHVVGDRVLQMVGRAVSRVVIRSSDLAARYGGEEFAVLLADSGPERGKKVAEDIRAALAREQVTPHLVQTASFGVAEGSELDQPTNLIARADSCLYKAKNAGRDQVVVAGFGNLGRRVRVPRGLQVEAAAGPVPMTRRQG